MISLGGIYLAWLLFCNPSALGMRFNKSRTADFFHSGCGFDRLYNALFVRPIVWLSEIDRNDFIDRIYTFIAGANNWFNILLSKTQNGKLRWYVLSITVGIVVILTLMISL